MAEASQAAGTPTGDVVSVISNFVQAHETQLKSSAYGVATQFGLMSAISVCSAQAPNTHGD